MSFGAPSMLLALVAVVVPIAIHLINRRRAQRVRFPALEFLVRSNRKLARRLKLKQILLLAMRIGVFLLIPLAMARPSVTCSGAPDSADGRLPTSVLIVIDDSASMSARRGDSTAYDDAVASARRIIRSSRSWDQIALVFVGDSIAHAVPTFTDDRSRVLRALGEHRPRLGGGELRPALAAAREIQATSRLPARRTIVLTDRAAHSLPDGQDLPVGGLGVLEWPELGLTATNVAVTSLEATRTTSGDYEIVGTVRGFGFAEASEVTVHLLVDGESVAAAIVQLDEGRDGVAMFTHRFEGGDAFEVGVMVDDPAGPAADDRRTMPLELQRSARVLVVNGDARSVSLNDEIFYLERALGVVTDGNEEFHLTRTAPDDLADHELAEFDVLVLANVAGLPTAEVDRVVSFVSAGGGLFVTAGENAVPERWNSSFSQLLPRPVRSVKVLASRGDPDVAIKATRFGAFLPRHPAFRVFSMPGGQSLQAGLVYSYLLLEPQVDGQVEVVASFADGGPALVERQVGRGRVMLLTTTIDYDWADLPVLTAYLPLVRRTIQYLARRGSSGASQVAIGERVSRDVGSLRADRVIVTSPGGLRHVLVPQAGTVTLVPEEAGLHQVAIETAGEELSSSTLAFSAHAPPTESTVESIPEEVLDEASAAASAASETVGDAAPGTPLWPAALFLALVAIYAETLLAVRRRVWVRLRERIGRRTTPAGL